MAANTQLSVTELDFDDIATSLKAFLRGQSQFADYNFEGSNMSVLIDLLSYVTYKNAFYSNMIANEMFLDTGLLRDSVVSRAKELNYVPSSAIGAQAEIAVSVVVPSAPSYITMPRGTQFQTTSNNDTYIFRTQTDYVLVPSGNTYVANVVIYEGIETTDQFVVGTDSRFILNNADADLSTLIVTVQNSNTDLTTTTFSRADDINTVSGTTNVYYVQESESQRYEVYFGDGVLGKSLSTGNIVRLRYHIVNGSKLNGANTFSAVSTIGGSSDITCTTLQIATGGADHETVDSIKFNAPKHFEIQNRCVTARDYERIIVQANPDITAISVWGGQDNVPPRYGTVFVSAKPSVGTVLSNVRKETIKALVLSRNLLTVDVSFVDPSYMYINVDTTVRYNPTATTKTAGQIQSAVLTAVSNFQTSSLGVFNKVFRQSRFQRAIDNADQSILSNDTTIELELRNTSVSTAQGQDLTFNFNQTIQMMSGSLSSSTFAFGGQSQCFLKEDGNGAVQIAYNSLDNKVTVIDSNAGTIDKSTGTVVLRNFLPTSIANQTLAVRVVPQDHEVRPQRNQIVLFGTVDVGVVQEIDQLALTSGQY